jgi:hypothetical protein
VGSCQVHKRVIIVSVRVMFTCRDTTRLYKRVRVMSPVYGPCRVRVGGSTRLINRAVLCRVIIGLDPNPTCQPRIASPKKNT